MKISIITITLNSEKTIRDTLNSVCSQSYKNIEHIIVDGGSSDNTLSILKKYPFKNKKIYIKKNFGIYKSINYGIKKSSGKFICILNSDDFFHSNEVIKTLQNIASKNKSYGAFLGDVAYFDNFDYYKITRFYSAKNFKRWKMKLGLMPPHPATLIKREFYFKYGLYNENFKIAGDFEFFLRLFYIKKIKYKIINQTIIRMRSGGISGRNLQSYWISTTEILKSFHINHIRSNIVLSIMRIPVKINQLFFYNNFKINSKFKLFKIIYDRDYYYNNSFKILNNTNKIPFKDNFILSGMNLAFLGYFANKELYTKNSLYHWPDGIWIKNHININKVPGRELLKKINLSKNIKRIFVLGNISKKSFQFLNKKFKLPIFHQNLPFGNINKILKQKIEIKKDDLVLITLPTPKQEKLALHLSKKNNNYKIICIGASVAIASGDEREVPAYLKNYEFLWRLRSDTLRRLKRIAETLIYYIRGKFINNIFRKVRFIIID